MKVLNFILITVFLFSQSAFSQEKTDDVIDVAENLYMLTGYGGNVGVLITESEVIIIDSGSLPEHGEKIASFVKSKTDKPITKLILTHYHGDHTHGIMGLPENISIIAHENIRKNLSEIDVPDLENKIKKAYPDYIKGIEEKLKGLKKKTEEYNKGVENLEKAKSEFESFKKLKVVYPDITFKKELTIYSGKDTLEIVYPGNCHTFCNCYVNIKSKKVLHTGDLLFHAHLPFFDPEAGANSDNWMQVLYQLSDDNYTHVIPGHGKLTTTTGLKNAADYMYSLRTKVKSEIFSGKSLDEIKKSVTMKEYEKWGYFGLLEQNIEGVYNEYK